MLKWKTHVDGYEIQTVYNTDALDIEATLENGPMPDHLWVDTYVLNKTGVIELRDSIQAYLIIRSDFLSVAIKSQDKNDLQLWHNDLSLIPELDLHDDEENIDDGLLVGGQVNGQWGAMLLSVPMLEEILPTLDNWIEHGILSND
jgi:hypothetical protein